MQRAFELSSTAPAQTRCCGREGSRKLLQWHEELKIADERKPKPVTLDTKKRVDAALARPVRRSLPSSRCVSVQR